MQKVSSQVLNSTQLNHHNSTENYGRTQVSDTSASKLTEARIVMI